MSRDDRLALRKPIRKPVQICTGVSPVSCELTDVSQTGARLNLPNPWQAPQEFILVLDEGLERWCQVVWRDFSGIGVKFVDPPESARIRI